MAPTAGALRQPEADGPTSSTSPAKTGKSATARPNSTATRSSEIAPSSTGVRRTKRSPASSDSRRDVPPTWNGASSIAMQLHRDHEADGDQHQHRTGAVDDLRPEREGPADGRPDDHHGLGEGRAQRDRAGQELERDERRRHRPDRGVTDRGRAPAGEREGKERPELIGAVDADDEQQQRDHRVDGSEPM